ncbi:hypothetical protein HG537_0D05960 [Torulaspora globosa]|uniref:LCCL domain-containing protein n=1 Tax=Torulaspora globosa TaxID=48254 RepID=A0A7H9HVW5_9SACH|nr:hypothetical protein HG537_0D05960 [Torulaspora sp. CBS 2947]
MNNSEQNLRGKNHSFLLDQESFQLDDLSQEGRTVLQDFRSDEDWPQLKRGNRITNLIRKIWEGPEEPSDEKPHFTSPLLQYLDDLPAKIQEGRFSRKSIRLTVLLVYCSLWFGLVLSLLYTSVVKAPFFYPNDGSDRIPIVSLMCNSYWNWEGKNNACGRDASACQPFSDEEYIIRCPALCDRGGWTYSAVAVGDQRIKYRGYEIGGGPASFDIDSEYLSYPYRGDSFACSSAFHAGIISPIFGGCARLSMEGSKSSFPGSLGRYAHQSVTFDSFFPSSFSFKKLRDGVSSGCVDLRMIIIMLNILFGLPVFYFCNGLLGYWIITIVGYGTISLALDPPRLTDPHDPTTIYELISVSVQRLLPLCFVLYVEWKCAVKRCLEDGSPVAKVLLWYPTFWLGVMNKITFDRLPVDRLTTSDLQELAGALTAVCSIAVVILTSAIIQAYSLWKSGRFRKYFKIYISIIFGIILLACIPGLNLRIHHYILGMILIPGCATRGRSAYLFQGILIGLILSGVARWDFASIVETDFALLRGEAGSSLDPPQFIFDAQNPHHISWTLNPNITSPMDTENINGYSLLINDFEVYVGQDTTIDLDVLLQQDKLLSSMLQESLIQSNGSIKLYLRLARASTEHPATERGDYTNAGILEWPAGIWRYPSPGVS